MDGNHFRETDADKAVRDRAYAVTAELLRQIVEQVEAFEAEKKKAAAEQASILTMAKGNGYDVKAIRKIVALRKRKPDDLAEEEAVLDMYKSAMGMQ